MNKVILTIIILGFGQLLHAQCLEGNCVDGFGKFSCDCGYVYEGEFVNGEKVNGTLTKEDLVYSGEFQHDLAHGIGLIKYKDGSWYKGSFVENYPDGYGTYYFSDGQKYIGQIIQGNFSGYGIQFVKDQDDLVIETQIGQFKDDVLEGYGCAISPNGDVYLGNFQKGEYAGFGYYFFKESGTAEAGEYKKKKLYDNGVLMDYPNTGLIGVEDYRLGKYVYDLNSDTQGDNITLQESVKSDLFRIVIYDQDLEALFISNDNDPYHGVVIKISGEILEGSVSPNNKSVFQVGKSLFSVGE